jgi:tetratricopeptide (TPR) repeat protein
MGNMQRHDDFSPEERAFLDAVKLSGAKGQSRCPPPSELRAFQSGVLPDSARAGIEEHVRDCGVCRTMLEDLPEVARANATREEESRIRARVFAEAGPKSVRPRLSWSMRLVPVFAALLMAIGVSWFYLEQRSHQKPTTSASIGAAVKPTIPDVFQLDRPAAEMPPVLIWRGAAPDQGLEAMKGALDLYQSGNYAEARSRFEALAASHPQSAEPVFYLGVCQLLLRQNAAAITSLEKARQLASPPLAGEASWYLSVALVREGDRSQAGEILNKLCQSPGAYQKRACTGFEELSRQPNAR